MQHRGDERERDRLVPEVGDEAAEETGAERRQPERAAERRGQRDPARGGAPEHDVRDGRRGRRREHAETESGRHGGLEAPEQPATRGKPGVQRHDDLHDDEGPERRIAQRVHRRRQDAGRDSRARAAPYTSVYAHMLSGDELVLEGVSGCDTPHTRIPVGRGVCGTAVATGRDQNVPDVTAAGSYLACNLETKSELVVLIRRGATILGQLDVDSDVPARFTTAHHAELKAVADPLAALPLSGPS